MKYLTAIFAMFLFMASHVQAGGTSSVDSSGNGGKPVVFLDCPDCDMDYFKKYLDIIAYSRDSKTAEVHVIVTKMPAGNGGSQYNMELSGREKFAGISDTLLFETPPETTAEELRALMLSKLERALLPYILKTPQADRVNVVYAATPVAGDETASDPWNNWVFSAHCMGSASIEKTCNSVNLMAGIYAGRVTEASKIEINANMNYAESNTTYSLGDGSDFSYRFLMRDYSLRALYVKSIGKHFGAGLISGIMNSSFSNLDLQMCIAPAVEYSLYDYSESSRRQLRVLYSIGYEHSDYHETTIYNRRNDRLFRHQLRVGYMIKEKFGQISAEFSGANYLDDFSAIDLGFRARTSINICKGLSVNANCSVLLPQNQRSIVSGEMDAEQVLTGQQQRETNFHMTFGFGISFWFGSKTNNVVNPRFEL